LHCVCTEQVAPGELWLNDGEGSQPRANCSFETIDDYYGQMQQEGWGGLSYFNLFEYGENVCGLGVEGLPPPCNFSGVPTGAEPSSAEPWCAFRIHQRASEKSDRFLSFRNKTYRFCQDTLRTTTVTSTKLSAGVVCEI
jgi:hypothetical protein